MTLLSKNSSKSSRSVFAISFSTSCDTSFFSLFIGCVLYFGFCFAQCTFGVSDFVTAGFLVATFTAASASTASSTSVSRAKVNILVRIRIFLFKTVHSDVFRISQPPLKHRGSRVVYSQWTCNRVEQNKKTHSSKQNSKDRKYNGCVYIYIYVVNFLLYYSFCCSFNSFIAPPGSLAMLFSLRFYRPIIPAGLAFTLFSL